MKFKMPKMLKKKITLTMPVLLILLAGVVFVSLSGYGYAYVEAMSYKEAMENHDAEEKEETIEEFRAKQPTGLPRSQIPPGDEDLWIKKSEIVPPVCPKCPDVSVCESATKCPPCPPCARCPEPAFDCKKVPNYSRQSSDKYAPRPVLSDFSQFGL